MSAPSLKAHGLWKNCSLLKGIRAAPSTGCWRNTRCSSTALLSRLVLQVPQRGTRLCEHPGYRESTEDGKRLLKGWTWVMQSVHLPITELNNLSTGAVISQPAWQLLTNISPIIPYSSVSKIVHHKFQLSCDVCSTDLPRAWLLV